MAMFKYWALKKYDKNLLPTLQKRYGSKDEYLAHEIRATVYQANFNPKYLPLAYMLLLKEHQLSTVMHTEFPHLSINCYKKDILTYLAKKSYQGQIIPKLA